MFSQETMEAAVDAARHVGYAFGQYAETCYLNEVDDVNDIDVLAGYVEKMHEFEVLLPETAKNFNAVDIDELNGYFIAIARDAAQVKAYEDGYMSGKSYPIKNIIDENVREGVASGYVSAFSFTVAYIGINMFMGNVKDMLIADLQTDAELGRMVSGAFGTAMDDLPDIDDLTDTLDLF